jgi:hypothetical protein
MHPRVFHVKAERVPGMTMVDRYLEFVAGRVRANP